MLNSRDRGTLHTAAKLGDSQAVAEILRDEPSQLSRRACFDRTPLMEAASMGHTMCLDLLLHHSAAINLQDRAGQTALHQASLSGHVACVDSLLRRGADPSLRTKSGLSCLMGASGGGHYAVVRRLLEHGGQGVDDTDVAGQTALWRACYHNFDGRITLELLLHGADASIRDLQEGLTAREVAQRRGRHACVKAIEWYEQESGRIYYLQKARELRSHELMRARYGDVATLPAYLREREGPLPEVACVPFGEEEADATFEFVIEGLGPELYTELMRGLWRTYG